MVKALDLSTRRWEHSTVLFERVVDLSRALDDATQVYPGDPEVRLRQHSRIAAEGFNLLEVSMGSQSGTHVDAPFHFSDSGARIDQVDLRTFLGIGVIADVRGLAPRAAIDEAMLTTALQQLSALGSRAVLLLRTGWEEHWGSEEYYEHPFLTTGAAAAIIATGCRAILLDAVNIDETPDEEHPGSGYPVHHLLADAGVIIGENFCNFGAIDFPEPLIIFLPLKLTAADGAPVRAVAVPSSALR
jgi:kynurenine formamidase